MFELKNVTIFSISLIAAIPTHTSISTQQRLKQKSYPKMTVYLTTAIPCCQQAPGFAKRGGNSYRLYFLGRRALWIDTFLFSVLGDFV